MASNLVAGGAGTRRWSQNELRRSGCEVDRRARDLCRELGERELRNVPLAIEGKAREDLVQLGHQPGVLDAFRLHRAGAEIAEVIVVLGGNRQMQFLHACFQMRAFVIPGRPA